MKNQTEGNPRITSPERNGEGDTWQFTHFSIWKMLATHSDSRERTQSRRIPWWHVFMSIVRVRKEWIDRKQCLEWGPIRPEVWATCGMVMITSSDLSRLILPIPNPVCVLTNRSQLLSLISWGAQESIATLTDLRANLSDLEKESLIGLRQNSMCIIPFICPL